MTRKQIERYLSSDSSEKKTYLENKMRSFDIIMHTRICF